MSQQLHFEVILIRHLQVNLDAFGGARESRAGVSKE